jgi:hypothetical protein
MHPWPDICALFHITSMTLWRWCHRAHITPHKDPLDQRRRYLDDAQLVKLARLHQRVLIVNTETAKLDSIVQMERRIAELEGIVGNKKDP